MSTVGEFRVPIEEFALSETLAGIPEAEFDVERAIPRAEGRMLVVLWARGPDYNDLREALEADPATVDCQGLVDLEAEWLYQMEWTNGLHVLSPAFGDHDATLMHAYGDREGWHLRLLAPDRRAFTALNDWCANAGLTLDVERVYSLDERVQSRFGLSTNQYEALSLAYERGYFDSPRRTSGSDLAAELGISQQALSERLRRASQNLLGTTIASDDPPTAFSYPDRWRTDRS